MSTKGHDAFHAGTSGLVYHCVLGGDSILQGIRLAYPAILLHLQPRGHHSSPKTRQAWRTTTSCFSSGFLAERREPSRVGNAVTA